MDIKKLPSLLLLLLWFGSCTEQTEKKVYLTNGVDESAGNGLAYIITTPSAIYYLEKEGGGLSSMIDKDNVDWSGFHNKEGSGHKGDYHLNAKPMIVLGEWTAKIIDKRTKSNN